MIIDQEERQTAAPSTTTTSQTAASVESKASIASAGKLSIVIQLLPERYKNVARLFTEYDVAQGILNFQCKTWDFVLPHIQ